MALAHAQTALVVPVGSGAPSSWRMICLVGVVALCAAGGWLLYGREATGDHGAAAALVVLVAAILSSVAGFAFSALAAALIFHIAQTGVEAILGC